MHYITLFLLFSLNFYTIVKAADDDVFVEHHLEHSVQVLPDKADKPLRTLEVVDLSERKYTEPFNGEPVTEHAELLGEEGNVTELMPVESKDGMYEFIIPNQDVDHRTEQDRLEAAEFGSLEKVDQTIKVPYRSVGNLLINFPHNIDPEKHPGPCIMLGSGVLIGPNYVLTAGHNVYEHERGGWAKSIIFTPAQNQREKPFGEARGTMVKVLREWQESKENHSYDLGIIMLDWCIGDRAGWSGLLCIKEQEKSKAEIAGYPIKNNLQEWNAKLVKKQTGDYTVQEVEMFRHIGSITTVKKRRLQYQISAQGGQSGSPLITEDEAGKFYTLGIHRAALLNKETNIIEANEGIRIASQYFDYIVGEIKQHSI